MELSVTSPWAIIFESSAKFCDPTIPVQSIDLKNAVSSTKTVWFANENDKLSKNTESKTVGIQPETGPPEEFDQWFTSFQSPPFPIQ